MAYEILPHTAEAGVKGVGSTIAEAFAEAVRGLGALMADRDPPSGDIGIPVSIEEGDPGAALVALLEEALYAADVRRLLPTGARISVHVFEDVTHVEGSLLCANEPIVASVKAITYHGLGVEQVERGAWQAIAYLDI